MEEIKAAMVFYRGNRVADLSMAADFLVLLCSGVAFVLTFCYRRQTSIRSKTKYKPRVHEKPENK